MSPPQLKQDKLILPNSLFILLWSVVFSLSIISYFSSAVFQISFQAKLNQALNSSPASICILLFCLIDTLISVNTGIIIDGKLVKNRNQNLRKYLFSMLFIADFILIILLIVRIILGAQNQDQYSLALSILDLGVCLKFYNIDRYQKDLKFYYFSEWSLLIYQFFKYLILLAFLCHIVGCLFFLIDVLMIQASWYDISEYWLTSSQAYNSLYTQDVSIQYLYSFYFSIVTLSTVAYGDITPLNPTQVAFVVCVLAFLLIFYAYIFTQIYEVVNWFNRKSIQIQQNKHKLANFLKELNISAGLSGKIISEYEFRQNQSKKTNKNIFINDISMKLAKNYTSVPYKHDFNKFMPRFIKRIGLYPQLFNQTLTQRFFTPQDVFTAVELSDRDYSQRITYFVPQRKVIRIIRTGSSSLLQFAEENRWLGINTFISSQYDRNQQWSVQTPLQLIALKFSDLKYCLKPFPKANQKFIEQCHRTSHFGGASEDLNKCLICWQGYHSSLYCIQYRPQTKDKQDKKRRQTSNLNKIKKIISSSRNQRQYIKRQNKMSGKLKIFTNIRLPLINKETQTCMNEVDSNKIIGSQRQIRGIKQMVWDWQYYMTEFNIPKHQNLVGKVERDLMQKLIAQFI